LEKTGFGGKVSFLRRRGTREGGKEKRRCRRKERHPLGEKKGKMFFSAGGEKFRGEKKRGLPVGEKRDSF